MIHTNNQNDVLDALKTRDNLFITGSAGSGKTYIIDKFCNNTTKKVVITATTGIAALNAGGETIHRFLGLGISNRPHDLGKIIGTWNKIKNSKAPWDVAKWKLIKAVNTIIIDEISMLRRDQFELIDAVLSNVRDNSLPFGGVQMVLVGDFLQLPPVVTDDDIERHNDLNEPYAFQSYAWEYGKFKSFNLTCNYRQGEGTFLSALESIRQGKVTPEIETMLSDRVDAKLDTTIEPVRLFSHRAKVDVENLEKLSQLNGEKAVSKADFSGKEFDINILKRDCPAEESLTYCVGAQIMMINNDKEGRWVNGTMGIVESIKPLNVRLSDGNLVTVEKFAWERQTHKVIGNNILTQVMATMTQYPFKLAYSTTIHKSQGLTLDFVDVDLSNCFSTGQAYVALSRARNLKGLRLTGFNKKSIMADKRVLDFYGLGEP